ncbi:LOW QUALITY PROTEIN: Protein CBG19947, partial [Caenorhabditis briggsae]
DNFCDRLYVGGFSTNLSSDQIRNLITSSAVPFEVTIEIVENGSRRHRGFAFVQCRNPAEANVLMSKFASLFTKVNYAKREPKPAENVMSNISNVFVRGISRDMTDTELYQAFGGAAEGVVQCHVADGYGFVLFDTRANAQKKITEMDRKVLNGKSISVSWARPDTMGRKRKRTENESFFIRSVSLELLKPFSRKFRIATTKIDILKANDFRPMKRGQHMWCDDDQKMIDEMPRRGSDDVEIGVVDLVRGSFEKWRRPLSAEQDSKKEVAVTKPSSNKVEKRVAVKWELPSAEYYAVRYEEHIRRNLNTRKPCGELETAQEALAVREKGEANDRTDQDCLTQPHDLKSSVSKFENNFLANFRISGRNSERESLLSEAPTQREKSPERKPEPIVKQEEEKILEKVPEEPKKVEEEPKKEEPVKVEESPKIGEKKEEVKVVEEKKPEPPVAVVPVEEKLKKRIQINVKRYPDTGDLTILSEKNEIVTFSCSTKHRVKKSKKTEK